MQKKLVNPLQFCNLAPVKLVINIPKNINGNCCEIRLIQKFIETENRRTAVKANIG
jgi:hypothetical protein